MGTGNCRHKSDIVGLLDNAAVSPPSTWSRTGLVPPTGCWVWGVWGGGGRRASTHYTDEPESTHVPPCSQRTWSHGSTPHWPTLRPKDGRPSAWNAPPLLVAKFTSKTHPLRRTARVRRRSGRREGDHHREARRPTCPEAHQRPSFLSITAHASPLAFGFSFFFLSLS